MGMGNATLNMFLSLDRTGGGHETLSKIAAMMLDTEPTENPRFVFSWNAMPTPSPAV